MPSDPDHLPQGAKIVTIPLAPRTARAIDLAIGERLEGPIFRGGDGQRLDRHAAWRIVRRPARRAGIDKPTRTPSANSPYSGPEQGDHRHDA